MRTMNHVELRLALGQIRKGTRSEARRRALKQAEDVVAAARTAQHALEKMQAVVDALMPGVRYISVQDYAALNNVPIEARDAVSKLRMLLEYQDDHDVRRAVVQATDR